MQLVLVYPASTEPTAKRLMRRCNYVYPYECLNIRNNY